MAATAAMAAAPLDRFDHTAILNNDALITYRGQGCPMGQRCHGASCMQANNAEGRKNDRLRKEKKGKEI